MFSELIYYMTKWTIAVCHRIPYYQTNLSCRRRVCVATAGGYLCTRLWRYTPATPVSGHHLKRKVTGSSKTSRSFRIAHFGQTNQRVEAVVKFGDVKVKHLFIVVQSWRWSMVLVYQTTKNPFLLKTTQYRIHEMF